MFGCSWRYAASYQNKLFNQETLGFKILNHYMARRRFFTLYLPRSFVFHPNNSKTNNHFNCLSFKEEMFAKHEFVPLLTLAFPLWL